MSSLWLGTCASSNENWGEFGKDVHTRSRNSSLWLNHALGGGPAVARESQDQPFSVDSQWRM